MNCRTSRAYNVRMRSPVVGNIRRCLLASSIRVSAEAARGATGACAKAEARAGAGTLEATANVTLSVEVSPAAR